VLVVGGGNVAVDVALTALRTGAKESDRGVSGKQGGDAGQFLGDRAGPGGRGRPFCLPGGRTASWGINGKVKAVELVACTCVFDEKGDFCPAFGDEKKVVEADQVILVHRTGCGPFLSFRGER
jgi:NADPH-dependent glutamate synthase beta subunit-like oxidoreductase